MDNILSSTNPDLSKEWHPTKNGDKTPQDVSYGSQFKAWWLCPKCGYEWQSAVNSSAAGGCGCPVCSNRVVWQGHNDLETVNPKLSSEWHPIKNGDLKPSDVVSGSNRKVWWLCSDCGHEWQAVIASRSSGIGCPVCANKRLWKGHNDLSTVNPMLAREWHPSLNEGKLPNEVMPGSNYNAWWLCSKCGHEWRAAVYNRFKGSGCLSCHKNNAIKRP